MKHMATKSATDGVTCFECGSLVWLDSHRGEVVCTQCYLVVEPTVFDRRLPRNSEAREGTTINTGLPTTRLFNEMLDARGVRINEEARQRIRRLSWLNSHTAHRKDRSIKQLFNIVNDACRKLQLNSEIRARAFYLMKKAYEKGVLRNQEFSLLAGASIRLAAQEAGVYVGEKALLNMLTISRQRPASQLRRAYRVVKRELGLYQLHTTPQMLLPRVSQTLSLSAETQRETRALLKEYKVLHRPEADLAAAIYVAAMRMGHPLNQSVVAKACGTSDVSLRLRVEKNWPDMLPAKQRKIYKVRTPGGVMNRAKKALEAVE